MHHIGRPGGDELLWLRTGRPGLFLDPAEAERQELGPVEVRCGLDDLQKRTGADGLMITARAHRGEVHLRSYELIADAYGLPAA